MTPIDFSTFHRIVILTGAGVSVASGLRPYRGPGGLWDSGDEDEDLASKGALATRPADAWRMYRRMRALASGAQPNPAHHAIAALERRFRGQKSVTVITQNVDGLHQRAGSVDVVELHGSIARTRCDAEGCALPPFLEDAGPDEVPRCPRCGEMLRPDVVLFDEYIPVEAEHRSKQVLRDCDLFIAAGTSGTVSPASSFVRWAQYAGARTYLVNLEPPAVPDPAFERRILGRAEELLPALFGAT